MLRTLLSGLVELVLSWRGHLEIRTGEEYVVGIGESEWHNYVTVWPGGTLAVFGELECRTLEVHGRVFGPGKVTKGLLCLENKAFYKVNGVNH